MGWKIFVQLFNNKGRVSLVSARNLRDCLNNMQLRDDSEETIRLAVLKPTNM